MQLTGPPKLNDYVAPYCSAQTPLEAAWRDESVIVQGRKGEDFIRERRLRGSFTLEWRGIEYDTALRILYEVRDGLLDLIPRTFDGNGVAIEPQPGEVVALEEVTLPCRIVGRVPASSSLNAYVGQDGTRVADLRLEMETRVTYSEVPGLGVPAVWTVDTPATQDDEIYASFDGDVRDQIVAWRVVDTETGEAVYTTTSTDLAFDAFPRTSTYRAICTVNAEDFSAADRVQVVTSGPTDWSNTNFSILAEDTTVVGLDGEGFDRVSAMEMVFDTSLGATGDYAPVAGTNIGLPLDPNTQYTLAVEVTAPGRDPERRIITGAPEETVVNGEGIGVSYEETLFNLGFEGEHRMKVAGAMPSMSFADQHYEDVPNKVLGVPEWSDLKWEDFSGAFSGCSNLLTTGYDLEYDGIDWTVPATSEPAEYVPEPVGDATFALQGCERYGDPDRVGTDCDIGDWETSLITEFGANPGGTETGGGMLSYCRALNQDLSGWDISSAIRMDRLLLQCDNFNNGGVDLDWADDLAAIAASGQGISRFFVSMFWRANAFNQPLESWTFFGSLNKMLTGTSFNQPVDTWDWTGVIGVNQTFMGTPFDQDMTVLDTSGIVSAQGMLRGCTDFNNGDVPMTPMDWSSCVAMGGGPRSNAGGMFENNISFNGGYPVGSTGNTLVWQTPNLTTAGSGSGGSQGGMLSNANQFNCALDFDWDNLKQCGVMFGSCENFNNGEPAGAPTTLDWPGFAPVDVNRMFADERGNSPQGNQTAAIDFNGDVSGWDWSDVERADEFAQGADSFNNAGQPLTLNTSSALDTIRAMLTSADSFNQPITFADTSAVTSIQRIVAGASAFDQPLDSIDVSSLTAPFDFVSPDDGDVFGFAEGSGMSEANVQATLDAWDGQVQAANIDPPRITFDASLDSAQIDENGMCAAGIDVYLGSSNLCA